MKKVSILGSSGSIGTQTLDVIGAYSNDFKVVALAVNSNIDILTEQVKEFSPELVCVYDENKALEAKRILGDKVAVVT